MDDVHELGIGRIKSLGNGEFCKVGHAASGVKASDPSNVVNISPHNIGGKRSKGMGNNVNIVSGK